MLYLYKNGLSGFGEPFSQKSSVKSPFSPFQPKLTEENDELIQKYSWDMLELKFLNMKGC